MNLTLSVLVCRFSVIRLGEIHQAQNGRVSGPGSARPPRHAGGMPRKVGAPKVRRAGASAPSPHQNPSEVGGAIK